MQSSTTYKHLALQDLKWVKRMNHISTRLWKSRSHKSSSSWASHIDSLANSRTPYYPTRMRYITTNTTLTATTTLETFTLRRREMMQRPNCVICRPSSLWRKAAGSTSINNLRTKISLMVSYPSHHSLATNSSRWHYTTSCLETCKTLSHTVESVTWLVRPIRTSKIMSKPSSTILKE